MKVTGSDLTLTVAGVALTGSFSFEQQTQADGTRLVLISVAASLSLGDGFLPVSMHGDLRIGTTGIAGQPDPRRGC